MLPTQLHLPLSIASAAGNHTSELSITMEIALSITFQEHSFGGMFLTTEAGFFSSTQQVDSGQRGEGMMHSMTYKAMIVKERLVAGEVEVHYVISLGQTGNDIVQKDCLCNWDAVQPEELPSEGQALCDLCI